MIVPLHVSLVGFVMADNAAGRSAQLAVPGHMARDASDDSAFNTSLCFGGGGSEYNAEEGNSKNDGLHDGSPGKKSLQQFGLQKIVPSIIDIIDMSQERGEMRVCAQVDARCTLMISIGALGLYRAGGVMRPSPLAIRASACFEQRVLKNLWLSATGAVLNGG